MISKTLSNVITFVSALIFIGFLAFVIYGLYTTCEDVAIYVYCEESER